MKNIISSIGITLNGDKTGYSFFHNDKIIGNNFLANSVYISDVINFSLYDRKLKRHERRKRKRTKYSKIISVTILEYLLKRKLSEEESESIAHYLNRRGYDYLQSDNDISIFEKTPNKLLQLFFTDYKPTESNFINYLFKKISHHKVRDYIKQWRSDCWGNILVDLYYDQMIIHDDLKNEIYKFNKLKNQNISILEGIRLKSPGQLLYIFTQRGEKNPKQQVKVHQRKYNNIVAKYLNISKDLLFYLDGKNNFLKYVYLYMDNYELSNVKGHFFRAQYFSNILHDIRNDQSLFSIVDNINAENLVNILGNVNNLKWKNLHRCFTNKNNDISLISKFYVEYLRFLKSLDNSFDTYDGDKVVKIKEHIKKFLNNDIVTFIKNLSLLDPNNTIPPYEYRSNKSIEKDRSLFLCPYKLTKLFPKWEILTRVIATNYVGLTDYMDHISLKDRSYLIDNIDLKKNSYVLQRFLDLNFVKSFLCKIIFIDDYDVITESNNNEFMNFFSKLSAATKKLILGIAETYYKEIDDLNNGIWLEESSNICISGNINVPKHRNLLGIRIASLLGDIRFLDKNFLFKFRESCWNICRVNRKLIKTICHDLYNMRKIYPSLFQEYHISYNYGELSNKEIKAIFQLINKVADVLAVYLVHSKLQKSYYDNPYTIIELYKELELNHKGKFSSHSKAAMYENLYRKLYLNLNKLCNDVSKPYDNTVRVLLEKKALTIASEKIKRIKSLETNSLVKIPIYIEHSKLNFESNISHGIKKRQISDKLSQKVIDFTDKIKDLYEEVRDMSQDICPYSGAQINDNSQLCKIIDQSDIPKKYVDIIYNDPLNFVHCALNINDDRKGFDKLHPFYLKKIFGNSNKDFIKGEIKNYILQYHSNCNFQIEYTLSNKDKIYIKHALFFYNDKEIFKLVLNFFSKRFIVTLNNTQKYFLKILVQTMNIYASKMKLKLEYSITNIRTEELELFKINLSKLFKGGYLQYCSKNSSSTCSVDAYLVNLIGLKKDKYINDNVKYCSNFFPKNIKFLPINSYKKYQVESKSIKKQVSSFKLFKESIYAEKFLPIWYNGIYMFIGFNINNCNILNPAVIDISQYNEKLYQFIRKYSSHNIPETLKIFRETHKRKWNYFVIDKNKAFEFLHSMVHSESSTDDKDEADMLNSLRYTVRKKNVKEIIKDAKYDSKFIKRSFELTFKGKGSLFKNINFNLNLPVKETWDQLFSAPEFLSISDNNTSENSFDSYLKCFFHNTHQNNNFHNRTKQIYSLPILESPTGAVRIRRKHKNGKYIYQLYSIDGYSSKGISYDYVTSDYRNVYLDMYLTKNLAPVGYKYKSMKDCFICYDKWITLHHHKNILPNVDFISMSWGTRDRRKFKIIQSWSEFLTTMNLNTIVSPFELDTKLKNISSIFDGKIKIRGGITILQTGVKIIYTCTADSCDSWFKNTYFRELEADVLPAT